MWNRLQGQVRSFHQIYKMNRIYRMKKEEEKYSLIPLALFTGTIITYVGYSRRDKIRDYIKEKWN